MQLAHCSMNTSSNLHQQRCCLAQASGRSCSAHRVLRFSLRDKSLVGKPVVIGNGSDRVTGRRTVVVFASNDPDESIIKQLPIFPLGVVALPAANVPLRIFEARYRVLFNTLLAGAEGLEEGLINYDSSFCGTKRFGMCYIDQRSNLTSVGTILEIHSHKRLDDGQMIIGSKGVERFKILRVVEQRPVLICDVQLLEEDQDNSPEVESLATEVTSLLRDTLRLNLKLRKDPQSFEEVEPPELNTLGPRELSFWIASLFADSPMQQQTLLEENSTKERLRQVKEVLAGTLKYLSATSALEAAFSSTTTEEPPVPPPGGPD